MTRALLAACTLALAAACTKSGASPVGGPPAVAATEARPCGGCHLPAEDGWRKSRHREAFRGRDFQRAFADDPYAFCADCHAPRRRDLGAVAAAPLGVDCVSCHTNAVLHEREALAGSPRNSLPSTAPCATCHEFSNPIQATMLQTTATEHRASAYADVACVDCHMQSSGGRRDHTSSVTRNPALLSGALAYEASEENGQLVVLLRSQGVGHRFPTGDLFRALEVHAWVEGPDGSMLAETATSLHRDWDDVRRVPGSRGSDTRLGESPTRIVLPAPSTRGAVLRVQVDYARGAGAHGDLHFTAFSRLRIADWTTPLR